MTTNRTECECPAATIVQSWYTEASILIGVDPEPESNAGKRLKFLVDLLQDYEKQLLSAEDFD